MAQQGDELESSGSLRASIESGLRFERGYGDPPPPPGGAAGMLQHDRYQVASVDEGFSDWASDAPPAADWDRMWVLAEK